MHANYEAYLDICHMEFALYKLITIIYTLILLSFILIIILITLIIIYLLLLYLFLQSEAQSAKCSKLLIELEVRSAKSIEARSNESRSDVAPNAGQADANLDQGLYIYIYIYIY